MSMTATRIDDLAFFGPPGARLPHPPAGLDSESPDRRSVTVTGTAPAA
jgi:hypothetical protein